MSKSFECSYRCNEKETARLYFELFDYNNTNSLRKKIYYQVFTKDYNQMFITWLCRYLLHVKNLDPIIVKRIIRRHLIIFVYSWLKDERGYDNKIKEFDEFLSKPLSYREILNISVTSNLSPLAKIFNDEKNYFEENGKIFNELKKELSKYKDKDQALKLINKSHVDFFINYSRDEMIDMEKFNIKQLDQIIAEQILNDNFYCFDIKINEENYEGYKNNIIFEESPTRIKEKFPLIFGILIDNLLKNNNYELNNPIDPEIFKCFQFITFDKNCTATSKKRLKIKFIFANLLDKIFACFII